MSEYLAIVRQEGNHLLISPVHQVGGGPMPPSRPVDPGYGVSSPPGIWGGAPNYPDQGLPPYPGRPSHPIFHPGHPDHGLPAPPGHPEPPIYHPGHPDHGLPSPGRPDQGLPVPPPTVDNTLPPVPPGAPSHPIILPDDSASSGLILIYIPGLGFRWATIGDKPVQLPETPQPQPKPV